jgi:lysophospholipase L1-like esterase
MMHFPAFPRSRFGAAVILLLVCAASPPRAAAEPVTQSRDADLTDDTLAIVVLGSSTAKGQGASTPDSSWVLRYRRAIADSTGRVQLTNLSVGGYTTYHFLPSGTPAPRARPASDTSVNISRALALRPSAIIVNLPSNDAAYGFDTTEQIANYQRLAAEARRDSVPLWVCTPQPRNLSALRRRTLAAMREWTSRAFGPRVIDFWSGLAREDGTLRKEFDSGDGTHLNNAGHRLLFERVSAAGIPGALLAARAARSRAGAMPQDSLTSPRQSGSR